MKFSESIKPLDKFGESISFKVRGHTKFGTWPGILITLVVYTFISCFAIERFLVMKNHEETFKTDAINTSINVDYTEVFTTE